MNWGASERGWGGGLEKEGRRKAKVRKAKQAKARYSKVRKIKVDQGKVQNLGRINTVKNLELQKKIMFIWKCQQGHLSPQIV